MNLKKVFDKLKTHKNTAKNAGLFFMASLVGMIISVAVNPFMALNLAHKDYAMLGYYASFSSLLSPLIMFSLISYYSRRFFIVNEVQRIRLKNTLLISLLCFSILISFLSFIGLYIYFHLENVSFPFYPYVLLSISSIFFGNIYSFMLTDLKMNRNAKRFFNLSLFHSLIGALLAIFFVVLYKGSIGKAYRHVILFFYLCIVLFLQNVNKMGI